MVTIFAEDCPDWIESRQHIVSMTPGAWNTYTSTHQTSNIKINADKLMIPISMDSHLFGVIRFQNTTHNEDWYMVIIDLMNADNYATRAMNLMNFWTTLCYSEGSL